MPAVHTVGTTRESLERSITALQQAEVGTTEHCHRWPLAEHRARHILDLEIVRLE
jgi:hypothetical protein